MEAHILNEEFLKERMCLIVGGAINFKNADEHGFLNLSKNSV